MSHYIGFFLSLTVFAIGSLFSLYLSRNPYKQKSFLKPFYIFAACVFLADVVLLFPPNLVSAQDLSLSPLVALLAAIHTAIRFFIVDCDFELTALVATGLAPFWGKLATTWCSVLIVLSPLMTAGAVLSFFANVSAHTTYFFRYFSDAYIFSELNEYSLSLATSLKNNGNKRTIVFTDVYDNASEEFSELLEKAKRLDAVIFKNDIISINFRHHSKKSKIYFFVIGSHNEENLNQTAALASKHDPKLHWFNKKSFSDTTYGYDYERGDTRIYLFTSSFSSEMQVKNIRPDQIRIRRVNERQSLVYSLLNDHGLDIFNSARETGRTVYNSVSKTDDKEKLISAVVIGMGSYGTEMIRALSWFGQMHPYRLEITAFDMNRNATTAFRSEYPELFDFDPTDENDIRNAANGKKYHNGDFETPGESHYKITINSGVDVYSHSFDELISPLTDTSYIFVSLGSDDRNIKISTKLRTLFRKAGIEPVIHTIVYNNTNQKMLLDDFNMGAKPKQLSSSLRIKPFGAISKSYSEECILNSQIEALALERHMKYTMKEIEEKGLTGAEKEEKLKEGEESFWGSDYNYRSSCASAIHTKFKVLLNIPGSDKTPANRTDEEKYFYANMEHQRWNAYTRSEGYVYGDHRDKLIKTHHLLVPFDDLPYSEQIKDDD